MKSPLHCKNCSQFVGQRCEWDNKKCTWLCTNLYCFTFGHWCILCLCSMILMFYQQSVCYGPTTNHNWWNLTFNLHSTYLVIFYFVEMMIRIEECNLFLFNVFTGSSYFSQQNIKQDMNVTTMSFVVLLVKEIHDMSLII